MNRICITLCVWPFRTGKHTVLVLHFQNQNGGESYRKSVIQKVQATLMSYATFIVVASSQTVEGLCSDMRRHNHVNFSVPATSDPKQREGETILHILYEY